jgi:hypothetical protein
MRYYSKMSPRQKLVLSNGSLAEFDIVDQSIGILKTDDQWLQNEFAILTREARGGIDEIGQAEYDKLVEKKKQGAGLPNPWRVELTKDNLFGVPIPMEVAAAASPVANSPPLPRPTMADIGQLRPSASRPMKAAGGSGLTR